MSTEELTAALRSGLEAAKVVYDAEHSDDYNKGFDDAISAVEACLYLLETLNAT